MMKFLCRAGIGGMVAVLMSATLPALAGAVVVRTPGGQLAGVAFQRGISPTSVPGVGLAVHAGAGKANGSVDYHDGPVVHSAAPYLIFWDPSSGLTARSKTVLEQYLTDVAAASGTPTDVYGVLRQYTDTTGFAAASQTFASGTQAIVDAQPYPTIDATHCSTATAYPNCVTDAQLRAELTRLIAADSLPTGTGPNAPIYFVITPTNVNVCDGSSTNCGSGAFCAYHSYFADGANTVLYSTVPFVVWTGNATKGCQFDGTAPYQSPNNDRADNIADNLSHELSETITDPLITGWYNQTGGNEVGDNCQAYASTSDPIGSVSANAYQPSLGGSAGAGTLYDQLITGDQYYTQTEWSNGDVNCEATPSFDVLSASFTDTAPVASGVSVSFIAASSTSVGDTITSTTWNFGDGSAPVFTAAAPATTSHTFTTPGVHTVTLTAVDSLGNLTTVSHPVAIGAAPTAAFAPSPAAALVNAAITFAGSGSSDANPGGSITGYSWNFGDGSAAGTGATVQHAYAASGSYTVTLTVADSLGLTGTVSHVVKAGRSPTAAFTPAAASGGAPFSVTFAATGSSDPNPGGSIAGYSWNFGDGSAPGTGPTPSHAFAHVGSYTVKLTVIDSLGFAASVSHPVLVLPKAIIRVLTRHPRAGKKVGFKGSSSADPGGRIVAYSWSFGDGHRSSRAKTSHTYAKAGTYRVKLTVADTSGLQASVTHTVVVRKH
jgi:PKD repeat protein